MRGTYRLSSKNGIYEAQNVITAAGKVRILNAVAGKSPGFASSIVVGIGTATATSADVALQYAVGGNNINAVITDPVNEKLYFKATLPAGDNYEIHELGCFAINFTGAQNSSGAGSVSLVNFGGVSKWFDLVGTSTLATTNNRIGVNSVQYASFSSAKGYMPFFQDLSALPDDTTFDLAYYANGLSDLIVRFKLDDTNYFQCDTWPITNGYNIAKIAKGDFTMTGTLDWTKFTSLEIEAAGTTATLSLDGMRYTVPTVSEAIDSTLLSRVVLLTPQQKLAGVSMDVEYVLELDI